jgi:hypothetical protein
VTATSGDFAHQLTVARLPLILCAKNFGGSDFLPSVKPLQSNQLAGQQRELFLEIHATNWDLKHLIRNVV